MTTKQILSLTLLTTVLMLNASSPIEIRLTTKQHSTSISTSIANILFKRGIDKEKSLQIVKKTIGENEELFSMMLQNYIKYTSSNKNDVLQVLAQFALNGKKNDLTSYSFLVKLTQSIHGIQINKEMYKTLEHISANNTLFQSIIV